MSTAFVTGATGMVGSALVRRLVEDDVDVVVLVLDPDPQSELYRSGLVAQTTVVKISTCSSARWRCTHRMRCTTSARRPSSALHGALR